VSLPLPIPSVGYLSIDSIATPARSFGPVPGGAALYATLGVRTVGVPAAIVATFGQDYPPEWLQGLVALGVDISHLLARSGPTRTASLHYDSSGSRQSPHFKAPGWHEQTRHLAPSIPENLRRFGRVTLGPVPIKTLLAVVKQARTCGVKLVGDTSTAFPHCAREAMLDLLPCMEIFAPSLEGTRLLLPGVGDDAAAIELATRATHVLQKRGAEGAFLIRSGERSGRRIAASSSEPVLDRRWRCNRGSASGRVGARDRGRRSRQDCLGSRQTNGKQHWADCARVQAR
jgi:sugar/nucleoside kinase (ribokinase family)